MDIRKLTPELADDYLRFFDETPHDDGIPEHRCYCVCWAGVCCDGDDFDTAESRRAVAARYIADGSIQGYLAYEGGELVGWCNANRKSLCMESVAGRMYLKALAEDGDERVKSVFCFVVKPGLRRHGIASALLRQVCRDAAEEDCDFVEAYPTKEFTTEQFDFSGPYAMYERQGFAMYRDIGDRAVVRYDARGSARGSAPDPA